MQVEVKTNLSRALELPKIRLEIIQYLDDCDLQMLTQIGRVIVDPELSIEDTESDNGSEITERIIDNVNCASWEKLHPLYEGINQK